MTAKGRAAADQQTGHQSGTLNLPTHSLTKANARATVAVSRRNYWVVLRDCKHTLCLNPVFNKNRIAGDRFCSHRGRFAHSCPHHPWVPVGRVPPNRPASSCTQQSMNSETKHFYWVSATSRAAIRNATGLKHTGSQLWPRCSKEVFRDPRSFERTLLGD